VNSVGRWNDYRHINRVRYPPHHKQTTRQRILDAAARAFRERGIRSAGVDDVMRSAGLTHGGFYSHFRDKEELTVSACVAAFESAIPRLERIAEAPTRAARVRLLVDSYLSTHHRDRLGAGCLVVALGGEMAWQDTAARAGFSGALGKHLDRVAAVLRLSSDPGANRQQTGLLMSALAGALLMARAMGPGDRSVALLRSMRERLKAEFAHSASGRHAPEPTNDFMRPI
jgi:TetR/AcrR family transcriptional repressor of nem operon